MSDVVDFAIVGAGMTGLLLAKQLKEKMPLNTIRIFEKSRGCGGRMATRRLGDRTFDHGAQFIRIDKDLGSALDFFQTSGIVNRFSFNGKSYICAKSGMTQFAKLIANTIDITFETKITSLRKSSEAWILQVENEQTFFARTVILTSPLPQATEILKKSNVYYDEKLILINYAKAIVFLLDLTVEPGEMPMYQELVGSEVFSLTLQSAKGTSAKPALTIVMTPEWSEANFERTDDEIIQTGRSVVSKEIQGVDIQGIQVKKWRYSHPINTWECEFQKIENNLYLAGDAFGGPSVIGATRSTNALADHIIAPLK